MRIPRMRGTAERQALPPAFMRGEGHAVAGGVPRRSGDGPLSHGFAVPALPRGEPGGDGRSPIPRDREIAPVLLRQHRTIASASLRRLFAPLLQFEKPEIHTGFLRFPNFELGQKSCLRLLAELRGAALRTEMFENQGDSHGTAPAFRYRAQPAKPALSAE